MHLKDSEQRTCEKILSFTILEKKAYIADIIQYCKKKLKLRNRANIKRHVRALKDANLLKQGEDEYGRFVIPDLLKIAHIYPNTFLELEPNFHSNLLHGPSERTLAILIHNANFIKRFISKHSTRVFDGMLPSIKISPSSALSVNSRVLSIPETNVEVLGLKIKALDTL